MRKMQHQGTLSSPQISWVRLMSSAMRCIAPWRPKRNCSLSTANVSATQPPMLQGIAPLVG
ncbi:unnamed protein product [Choristocarpus tenellus]